MTLKHGNLDFELGEIQGQSFILREIFRILNEETEIHEAEEHTLIMDYNEYLRNRIRNEIFVKSVIIEDDDGEVD